MQMADTTPDQSVRLIRVQPNPVFLEPKHLPIRPLTQPPIEIERPPDYLTSCIHRADFNDIHPDLLMDYAKYYDIKIDYEKLLQAEILAVLCMKNEWIPILPEHNAAYSEDGTVLLSKTADQSIPEDDEDAPIDDSGEEVEPYIPEFDTPEDNYDDDVGFPTEDADLNSKDSEDDTIGDINFNNLPSNLFRGDLAKLTSRLQARHARVQCALKDATAATREAAADVLEMAVRLANEKTGMKKVMGTVSEIDGECDEEIDDSQLDEGGEEEEEVEMSLKRKGKGRVTEPIHSVRSSFDQERDSPVCPSCHVARDLTVSQRHSVYHCAEHMPNPRKANGNTSEGSSVPASAIASSSSSARNNNDARSHVPGPLHPFPFSRDTTIIFGLTTKPAPTQNLPPKGKKRSLDDEGSKSSSNNPSPKRARVEESQDVIVDLQERDSQRNPPSTSTPLRRTISICDINDPEEVANAEREDMVVRRGIPSRHTNSVSNLNGPGENANAEREEASARRVRRLRRRFTIDDFDDPAGVAEVERLEALYSSEPRRDVPLRRTLSVGNLNVPRGVANVARRRRRNAPLRRTLSISNLNDAEEVANIAREERLRWRYARRRQPAVNPNAVGAVANGGQVSATSSTNAPRSANEVANAENSTGPSSIPITAARRNGRLRRTFAISNFNDPIEVARVERLSNARVDSRMSQGPGVDVSRRVPDMLSRTHTTRASTSVANAGIPHETHGPQEGTAPASLEAVASSSSVSASTTAKRSRDSEDDDNERAQKKARVTDGSDGADTVPAE